MIVHAAEQGSVAWIEARLGIPTASRSFRASSLTAVPGCSPSSEGQLLGRVACRVVSWRAGHGLSRHRRYRARTHARAASAKVLLVSSAIKRLKPWASSIAMSHAWSGAHRMA